MSCFNSFDNPERLRAIGTRFTVLYRPHIVIIFNYHVTIKIDIREVIVILICPADQAIRPFQPLVCKNPEFCLQTDRADRPCIGAGQGGQFARFSGAHVRVENRAELGFIQLIVSHHEDEDGLSLADVHKRFRASFLVDVQKLREFIDRLDIWCIDFFNGIVVRQPSCFCGT